MSHVWVHNFIQTDLAIIAIIIYTGNIFHVQVSTPADNFALDHALLYCIGVNLPNHHFGQLDRVLVVASAINDVNLHAWNLSRVKRFMLIEAGIQMELCGSCMGHRKKTVTFLISPEFIQDCMEFLVKEARLPDEPKQMLSDGPIYYSLPHSCSVVEESSQGTIPSPTYTNAEMIVLGKEGKEAYANVGLYINYDGRGRSFSTSSTILQKSQKKGSTLQPALPPRGVSRTNEDVPLGSLPLKPDKKSVNHFESVPYQINHRIYVNKSGVVREDSHVLGSGTWEHSSTKSSFRPPLIPPREDSGRFHPLYVGESDIHTPISPTFQRPEFIGKNPPCLPPRDNERPHTPQLPKRSTSDSNLLTDSFSISPSVARRNSEYPSTSSRSFMPFESPDSPPPSFNESFMYQNVPSHTQQNTNDKVLYHGSSNSNNRSPSPQMCTDDMTNADFALITKVSFNGGHLGHILPPRNQTRGCKRPVPVPRNKRQQHHTATTTSSTTATSTATATNAMSFQYAHNIETDISVSLDMQQSDFQMGKKDQSEFKKEQPEFQIEQSEFEVKKDVPAGSDGSPNNQPAGFNIERKEVQGGDFSSNPLYSMMRELPRSSSNSSSPQDSPVFYKKMIRSSSYSTSSLSSEDYKKTLRAPMLKKYSQEI